tara:strand:+ start:103 stop:369 length:267 start_codon:yes stop_codon:yes gene_type:complete
MMNKRTYNMNEDTRNALENLCEASFNRALDQDENFNEYGRPIWNFVFADVYMDVPYGLTAEVSRFVEETCEALADAWDDKMTDYAYDQ